MFARTKIVFSHNTFKSLILHYKIIITSGVLFIFSVTVLAPNRFSLFSGFYVSSVSYTHLMIIISAYVKVPIIPY